MKKKRIGILGSGNVGKSLAGGFLRYGYQVMLGTRNAEKLREWKSDAGEDAFLGSFEDAAAFGDILVLAVKGKVALEVINGIDSDHLKSKTILDATNPIDDSVLPENGILRFFTDPSESLMEKLQRVFPDANFVKAFSCIGSGLMVNPPFEQKPSMFICGNSEKAKKEAEEIISLFGFDIEDMGKADAARAIEPLCILWCIPGFNQNQWTHAFKLMKL